MLESTKVYLRDIRSKPQHDAKSRRVVVHKLQHVTQYQTTAHTIARFSCNVYNMINMVIHVQTPCAHERGEQLTQD